MIILRTKQYALLEKKQYYKNNWDRLKHGWFGTSKESIDKYNNYVSKHNAEEKKLSGLLKNNPRQYLIELYNLDTVTNKLREFEKVFNTKLPQDIFKYIEAIKSFAGPLKNWAAKYPNENHRGDLFAVIGEFAPTLMYKNGDVEDYRKDMEDGGNAYLFNFDYDGTISYNFDHKRWLMGSTKKSGSAKTLKDTLLPTILDGIDADDEYAEEEECDEVEKRIPERNVCRGYG